MYSVALVQNQSEMAHYSYADARPLLSGYTYQMFTGDNIGELATTLARRQVNALVLASNALNDRDIMGELFSPRFGAAIQDFLAARRGVFCLQQLGLAMRRGPRLEVLPEPWNRLLPTVVPPEDPAKRRGQLVLGSPAAPHVSLIYPDVVNPAAVRTHAVGFRALPGLYWHYWEDVDLTDWDQLLVDPSDGRVRSLVVAAKGSATGRIVASALPLDWQKQTDLFRNLLMYVVEGRHHLATINLGRHELADDYLRESLKARWIPFGEYTLPRDTAALDRNVRNGIHSTLLAGTGVTVGALPPPLSDTLGDAVRAGTMRVIDIGAGAFGTRSMSVISRELRPRHLLLATEARIQQELREGYVDDSFWSHVEALQTLEQLPDRTVDYGRLQDAAFAITRNHDRGGSYDEIFGPTCAYYWLRARYLGVDSAEAKQSSSWLRAALQNYGVHERVLAYLVLAAVGQLSDAERADLAAVTGTTDLSTLSESELVQFLRAGIAAGLEVGLVVPVALALAGRQRDGVWIDLTTTASAANALLDTLSRIHDDPALRSAAERIESSARDAVVFILRMLAQSEASPERHPYPWDGKARTTTKCLQAWMKFDGLQDLPVFELLESLERADRSAGDVTATRSALTVLQEISQENIRLREENLATAAGLRDAAAGIRLRTIGLVAAGVTGYLLVTLLIGALMTSGWAVDEAVRRGFVKGWGFHSGLIGLSIGVYGFYQQVAKRWLGRIEGPGG